mgnify:CR=1 FL=1
MKNPHRALDAIERLVGGDFGMDMEWLLHKKEKVDPRLKTAAKIITDIYIIAHAEGQCGGGHPSWEDKKYKILKKGN